VAYDSGTAVFQLYTLFFMLLPLFGIAFFVYFFLKVIKFMQKKTEQRALLLEKIDKLIDLQERK
jgi:bacteriorhodopsin